MSYRVRMLTLLALLSCATDKSPVTESPAVESAVDSPADSPTDDSVTESATDDSPVESPADSPVESPADDSPADTGEPEPELVDLRQPGPHPVSTSGGQLTVSSGCALDYYYAAPPTWSVLVVLLHGLERSDEQMRSTAEHLASWGVAVVAPSSCDATVTDLDQAQNGRDAIELAAALGQGVVIYAGHSAGGLAAFVAAAEDANAIAYFGLDPTEFNGVAESVAAAVTVPAYAAIGSPGVCNLNNNFLPILDEVPQSRALRVVEADHCDFEEPTDWVCTLACGQESNDLFSEDELRETVLGLTTAFIVWQAGLDATGESWWTPGGAGYEQLLALGAISAP